MDKAKETLTQTQSNVHHMLDMTGLIEQADSTLNKFFTVHLKIEGQYPIKLLSEAKAIIFLTIVKGGVGLTSTFGTGIMIVRKSIGRWSGPCAIALVGVDIGLNIGIEKSDHVIILRDKAAIHSFASKGQLKLGIDASIAVGSTGRSASAGLFVGDRGYATMISYSMAKGAYIGLSFEGQIITVRDDCNEQYYGKKVSANEILDGTAKATVSKNLTQIYDTIDECITQNFIYPEHSVEL